MIVAENNRTAIEATLVNYYNAKSRLDHSYLDIVQTICSEVTSFCPGGGGAATEVPKVRHSFLGHKQTYVWKSSVHLIIESHEPLSKVRSNVNLWVLVIKTRCSESATISTTSNLTASHMGWCQNDLSVWMNIKILLIIIQASVYDNESNSTATVISDAQWLVLC